MAERRQRPSWAKGAEGEQRLGAHLERIRSPWLAVLYDRRIPNSPANIDHIVVGRAGVFVIDAKRYAGKVERVNCGSFFKPDWRLVVDGSDRTELVTKMQRQLDAVDAAVSDAAITPAICFTNSEWPLFPTAFRFGDVRITWPGALFELLESPGPLNTSEIRELERRLAATLPAA